MATLSPPSSLHSIRFSSTIPTSSSSPPSLAFCTFLLQTSKPFVALKAHSSKKDRRVCITKAVEEETQQVQEEEATTEQQEQRPVVVPVSPSDTLTMLFQVTPPLVLLQ